MAKSTLKDIPVSIGETIELNIESMAYDNAAVSKYKDFVVFVNRGAPGDKVKAEITTIKHNYARAKIIEVLDSNPDYRIESECKIYKVCGGCQWQHLPYEKQVEQKQRLLENFFSRFNLKDGIIKETISSLEDGEGIWFYRNKVQYPVRTVASTGRLKAGYFDWNSNDLVNIKHCPIQNKVFESILDTVRDLAPKYRIKAYDSKLKKGWLRHICLRHSEKTDQVLLTLVAASPSLDKSEKLAKEVMARHPELVGFCVNVNKESTNVIYGGKTHTIKGNGFYWEEIEGIKYKVSATSFFQVNTLQAIQMLKVLKDGLQLTKEDVLLDAYCGVGLLTLSFAKQVKEVIGIEEIFQAIEDGKDSVKENNLKNVTLICGKVENKIDDIAETRKPNVVVLDPPRAGCTKKVIKTVLDLKPEKIAYVSCNPNTLVRDLEKLTEGGYKIDLVQPLDMFPHTYHLETVVLLKLAV